MPSNGTHTNSAGGALPHRQLEYPGLARARSRESTGNCPGFYKPWQRDAVVYSPPEQQQSIRESTLRVECTHRICNGHDWGGRRFFYQLLHCGELADSCSHHQRSQSTLSVSTDQHPAAVPEEMRVNPPLF